MPNTYFAGPYTKCFRASCAADIFSAKQAPNEAGSRPPQLVRYNITFGLSKRTKRSPLKSKRGR